MVSVTFVCHKIDDISRGMMDENAYNEVGSIFPTCEKHTCDCTWSRNVSERENCLKQGLVTRKFSARAFFYKNTHVKDVRVRMKEAPKARGKNPV